MDIKDACVNKWGKNEATEKAGSADLRAYILSISVVCFFSTLFSRLLGILMLT